MKTGTGQRDPDACAKPRAQGPSWPRNADAQSVCRAVRHCVWTGEPDTALSRAMAGKGVDLGTAITVFFNGAPGRFNLVPKRDVPRQLRHEASLLDSICLRINAGFYLVWPDSCVDDPRLVTRWLDAQRADRFAGRQGRYVLDEKRINTVLDGTLRPDPVLENRRYAPRASILRDVLSPVAGLGVSRDALRFLPEEDETVEEEPRIEL